LDSNSLKTVLERAIIAAMFRKTICACGLLVLLASSSPSAHNQAVAQEKAATQKSATTHDEPKPLDPNDPRLTFSFPIQPGGKFFRFKVNLDDSGTIMGVSVFRGSELQPFQTLQDCGALQFPDQLNENWIDAEISEVLKHADLNFDGFEDLELLQYDNPHLDKRLYCIYLWDNKTRRFSYSKDLTDIGVDIKVHPENKTLTTREDWFGGPWQESTYRWNGGKLEMIEQNSLLGDWSMQKVGKCGWVFNCSRLTKGEMVTTLEKPVCTPEEMDSLPNCPGAAAPTVQKVPAKKPTLEKKDCENPTLAAKTRTRRGWGTRIHFPRLASIVKRRINKRRYFFSALDARGATDSVGVLPPSFMLSRIRLASSTSTSVPPWLPPLPPPTMICGTSWVLLCASACITCTSA
jgi:hypothetical protein